jgi:hypothetical protein
LSALNKRSLTIALAAAAALFALWLVLSRGDERVSAPNEAAEDEPAERAAAPAPVPPPMRVATAATSAAPRASIAPSPDDNVVGPHPDDPHMPGMHPHPITPEHERLYAENRLIQRLNDAMSFRKAKEMREMLVEYRKLDPEDVHLNQAGYEIICDCIEFPGDASLTAARHFYDTERHSTLRRFVRRVCFENQAFP